MSKRQATSAANGFRNQLRADGFLDRIEKAIFR
jgi:hypothetical protein